jgi:hypothetical protein
MKEHKLIIIPEMSRSFNLAYCNFSTTGNEILTIVNGKKFRKN